MQPLLEGLLKIMQICPLYCRNALTAIAVPFAGVAWNAGSALTKTLIMTNTWLQQLRQDIAYLQLAVLIIDMHCCIP